MYATSGIVGTDEAYEAATPDFATGKHMAVRFLKAPPIPSGGVYTIPYTGRAEQRADPDANMWPRGS